MTDSIRTFVDQKHRRTILIAALIVIGVCLLAVTVGLSFYVPLPVEDESSVVEGQYWPP